MYNTSGSLRSVIFLMISESRQLVTFVLSSNNTYDLEMGLFNTHDTDMACHEAATI